MTAEPDTSESRFTPPGAWCPRPERWHSDDAFATEREVTALVAGFARALQPDVVVETGTHHGQTAEAIALALKENGHGRLYTCETNPVLVQFVEQRLTGLPVTVVHAQSTDWLAELPPPLPVPVGLAWLDSSIGDRPGELELLTPYLAPGAVVGFHDTAPHHELMRDLAPLIEAGRLDAITLRTPRGVTFAQVREA